MNKAIFFSILLCVVCIFCTCKKKNESCLTCPPPPIDTTSHLVQWQAPDTLGAQGLIRDVWVFDRNNAWAVGEIYLNDSTGKPDMSNLYNAAQWTGSKWTLKKIPYNYQGQPFFSALYSIFAFSPSDIWFAGGLIHWDGNQFSNVTVPTSVWGPVLIKKIWGTASNDLFIVGDGGSIAHYNGSSWTKMTSNTTVDLQDIWGIDATHIWATGFNNSDGHCVVLQCNGASWTTIYNSATKPPNEVQYFNTVWTDNVNYIYLDGGSYLHKVTLNPLSIGPNITTGLTYTVSRIRGINQNDIYDVTTGGEVAHYNGSSWHCYPEIQTLGGGNAGWGSVYPKNDFVVIGGSIFTGLNGFPVVVRGYR